LDEYSDRKFKGLLKDMSHSEILMLQNIKSKLQIIDNQNLNLNLTDFDVKKIEP